MFRHYIGKWYKIKKKNIFASFSKKLNNLRKHIEVEV